MLIDGFGIRNYRSFGPEPQYFGPLNKVSLFIGQNNCGKSNILRFASNHLADIARAARQRGRYGAFSSLDETRIDRDGAKEFALGLKIDGDLYQSWIEGFHEKFRGGLQESLRKLTEDDLMTDGTDLCWFWYELRDSRVELSSRMLQALLESDGPLSPLEWSTLWQKAQNATGATLDQWVPAVMHFINPTQSFDIGVESIPAIREIRRTTDDTETDFSGAGLIGRLARYQDPGYDEQEKRQEFNEINAFLQAVSGSSSAQIRIPADRDTILVDLEGRVLPLEALGTGIHEVVILAAAATICSERLVCIEEPEIHLHPTLQRKLLRYLRENTSNQYLIATHSAHLLDEPETSVIHVQMVDGASIARNASTAKKKSEICIDLGYRPSDLLQANSIIWVEGPSDRIYLRHWLSKIAPDLVEGIQYSIMFYGGRLLCHLTANDPEVDEFISLRRLNRQVSILIDGDRSAKGKRLNDTKIRVRQEVEEGPGLAWVTKGREIENYVPPDVLEQAIMSVHPNARSILHRGTYAQALKYKDRQGKNCAADKVKVAREVVAANPTLDVLDLRTQLNALVRFIRAANE